MQQNKKNVKSIYIDEELWKSFKIYCYKKNKNMSQLISDIIKKRLNNGDIQRTD